MTSSAIPLEQAAVKDDFKTGQVLPVVGAHFAHDIYTAGVPPLLPVLIEKLSLSLTQAGALSACLQIPSLLNPLIGYLGDKVNLRWFVILAPAITATLLSAMGLTSSYGVLAILFFCAGISIAAFHATAPAMVGRVAGRQVGLGMSLFMAGGELAYTLGPLLAVWAVTTWTLDGMWRLVVIGWAASLILLWRLRVNGRGIAIPLEPAGSLRAILPQLAGVFIPLTLINLFRNPLMESISTFLPTYLSQRGASLWLAGAALSLFDLAGLCGVLLSGWISDRAGRKQVLIVATLASSVLALVFINVSGWLTVVVLLGLGLFASSSMPVYLAIAQEHFPNNRAVANSLVMMIVFVLRPLGTLIVGYLGDHIGLQAAYFWSALVYLLMIPAILALPDKVSGASDLTASAAP
jgi:FSR family fosmidomycin resistance protein-like MFS transporter